MECLRFVGSVFSGNDIFLLVVFSGNDTFLLVAFSGNDIFLLSSETRGSTPK